MIVTLSGGTFGGELVELADGVDEIEKVDESGATWRYSRAGIDGGEQAVFVAYIPAG